MKKQLCLLFLSGSFLSLFSQDVKLEKKALPLPTYEAGAPDVNPIFYTGRTYQGAKGPIYPYPMYDILTDKKTEKSYEALYLENEYINICVLPEMGGRIFSATDKSNGYDFFYRQTGIKPALIGMLGAWLSGGVEWNFPHHHRPSSFMDIDYTTTENEDGSKTIWVGETELRHRFKWSVGVTVHPDRSYIEAKVRIMNRSPFIQSMLYWANVSVHCGPDYEVIFPPATQFGTDHSKVAFTQWQMGEAALGSGNTVDLAWWKNYTGNSRSIFAWNFEDDFLAGYDHNKQAGTVHVANHHIVNGKKFFLWGNNSSARMWDQMLSDNDGPYLELMVGAYSDNQPDYSWIGPGEIREFSQFWYPIRDIQDVKNANYDAAVNLEKVGKDKVFIGYNATTVFKNAKVVLKNGEDILFTKTIHIDPEHSFTQEIKIPANVDIYNLSTALYDANGNELVSYQPVKPEDESLPEAVEPVKKPEEFTSIEELYQAGLRLEQFHNARLNPMDYYNEALKRDSADSRVNTVVGIHYAKQGKWDLAEKHLALAIKRQTQYYTITKDPEAYYNLGVVYQYQKKYKEAADCFWKATWYPTFQSPAYFALSQIECIKGDYHKALEYIQSSLDANVRNTKGITLKAYILRKLNQNAEALLLTQNALLIDPLDYWSAAEKSILENKGTDFLNANISTRGEGIIQLQEFLEIVDDYSAVAAYDEALGLLNKAVSLGQPYNQSPLIYYYTGYFHSLKGDKNTALSFYQKGKELSPNYSFPFRLEEIDLFERISNESPFDDKAFYYLGNLLYYLEQKEKGIESWRKSEEINPQFALVQRNLGFALERDGKKQESIAFYEKAIANDPDNPRMLVEIDKLYEQTGKQPEDRLAFLQKHMQTVMKHDDAVIRLLILYNETGAYDEAIRLLEKRHFHVWEGGGQIHDIFADVHLLKGLDFLDNKLYNEAINEFTIADTYPENLEVGRPQNGGKMPKIYYYMGNAYDTKGDKKKAKDCYEKASASAQGRRSRQIDELNIYRAMAHQKLGNKTKADELINACDEYVEKQLNSNNLLDEYSKFGEDGTRSERLAQLYYMKGLVYFAKGENGTANEYFQKAINHNKNLVWPKQLLSTF